MNHFATTLTALAVLAGLAGPALASKQGAVLEEGLFVNDKRDGDWVTYGADGHKVVLEHFDAGLRTGHWQKYYENGQLQTDGYYRNDKQDGTWTNYFRNGKRAGQQVFNVGLREGHWQKWYEDGQLAEDGCYRLDKQDGTWTSYFTDGTKSSQGTYRLGQREGRFTKWAGTSGTLSSSHLPDGPFDLDFEAPSPLPRQAPPAFKPAAGKP